MIKDRLIEKYNVQVPRYTSYPTVPMWDAEIMSSEKWMQIVEKTFNESNSKKGISIYMHLPFCESLCTYCGCNKRITKNHNVEGGYIDAILSEWQIYLDHLNEKPLLRELHLGGGTPTFFKAENLDLLLEKLLSTVEIHPKHEFGFEGHPNNTTEQHLQVFFDHGFKRVSYGIQDLDLKVQQAINRIQPFKNVQTATDNARKIGYDSINFDLIYGLPFQTPKSMEYTINRVGELMPDRIAFYSYAHVPWLKKSQRGYSEADLPVNDAKRALYELGREKLLAFGYKDVGMDHFALPGDSLYKAFDEKRMHRNFMGYTVCNTDLLIGLGTSAISDAKYGYMQNLKVVEHYKEQVLTNTPAILKGHTMSDEDLILKKHILDLLCNGSLNFDNTLLATIGSEALAEFEVMENEGLLALTKNNLHITEKGKAFIRNIAAVLDLKLKKTKPNSPIFSKAI